MLDNLWEHWGIMHSTRDGYTVISEESLWQLTGKHPEAVEQVSPTELYLHLDQPYRVYKLTDRGFRILLPAPGRTPPAKAAKATHGA